MVARSRGVRRPVVPPEIADRLPPGQFLTQRWPVLHYGDVPPFDPALWDFRVYGMVRRSLRLTWEEFSRLPTVEISGDMHCVTRWSKLDNRWGGVRARDLLEQAGLTDEAAFVVFHCERGYTANLPLDVAMGDNVLFATTHDGETLSPEHGYPVRAVVPEKYAWKSAKWLRAVEVLPEDRLGFWENYGYHSNADPFKEERFADERTPGDPRQVASRGRSS